jgi:hypothetical protein
MKCKDAFAIKKGPERERLKSGRARPILLSEMTH